MSLKSRLLSSPGRVATVLGSVGVVLAVAAGGGLHAAAAGGSDLAVSARAVGTPTEGGQALFQVTVTNNGPDPAFQVTSTGSLSVQLGGVNSATAVCATARNSVWTCIWGTLPSGSTVSYLVSGRVGSATSVTVNATVSGPSDPDFTNNRSSATAAVAAAPPDLQLSGSASTRAPDAGATFDLRYQVKVAGKSPAPGITFSTTLPAELVPVSAVSSPGLCTVTGQDVSCNLLDLPGGSSGSVTITVTAPAEVGVTSTVDATVLASNGDSNLSNNSVTLTDTTR